MAACADRGYEVDVLGRAAVFVAAVGEVGVIETFVV